MTKNRAGFATGFQSMSLIVYGYKELHIMIGEYRKILDERNRQRITGLVQVWSGVALNIKSDLILRYLDVSN